MRANIPVALVLGIFLAGCASTNQAIQLPQGCTKEAKMCPNGTTVTRIQALNCEFAACDNTLPVPQNTPVLIKLPGIVKYDPSIFYDASVDYTMSLEFETGLMDPLNSMYPNLPIKSLTLLPISPELRKELMAKVNQRVVISGYIEWGAAESKHIKAIGFN